MEDLKDITKVFKALADSSRVRIIKMLESKPLCVCEITFVLNLSTSTVSKHLSILRDCGLILDEKNGKWVNYMINPDLNSNLREQLINLVNTSLVNDKFIKLDKANLIMADRNLLCNI